MSYDISLIDPITDKVLQVKDKHYIAGGTYAMGGTTDLSFNITYNYAKILYNVLGDKGIRTIYGLTGIESVPILVSAISKLQDDTNDDYWISTEGNVKKALQGLLDLAELGPTGIWCGD